jgi:hypothetical protein
MGAVWINQSMYYTILLPDFQFKGIKGAINPMRKAIHLDWPDEQLKGELTVLKDQLSKLFSLQITELTWGKYRDDFIKSVKKTDNAVRLDLKNSQGICIGDTNHAGMNVKFEKELQRLSCKVNFNKTIADICCIVIHTGDLKIKRKIELEKCLKFSMKASKSIKTIVVEIVAHTKNNNIVTIHYDVPANREWSDYRILLKDFIPQGTYEHCSELKFTIFKDKVQGVKGKISVRDVEFE